MKHKILHMTSAADYISTNKNSWNNRVDIHYDSKFYDVEGFLNGQTSLNPIELELLGDIQGKSILHLQCHFGMDSISLARMGAKVTGIDLSDRAIQKAKELAEIDGQEIEFICCNIYDIELHLDKKYDIIFTSYGTITWLPDLDKWASMIHQFLQPGGKFILVEFHPFVWSFDDQFEKIGYNYFKDNPIVETESGTYAEKGANITQTYVSWNHSLSETIQSLINQSLRLENFQEYDYSPYDIFFDSEEVEPKKFRIKKMGNRLPLLFSLVFGK